MGDKLRSRKFWMAVAGALLIILNRGLELNLPAEQVMSVAAIIVGYLVGQGYVDGQAARNGK